MKLPNGYGTVYKLSGNRRKPFIVRKTTGYDDNGKQMYSTIGYYETREEGLQALAAFNDNPYDIQLSKITFSEIYRRWFDDTFDENSNRSTKKNYEAAYKHSYMLYDMKMSDIRPHHMQQVLDECPGGYQTVKRVHTLFNQLYKWCLQHDCIKRNYAENTKINVKYDPKPRDAFSSEEIQLLWDNIKNNHYISIVLMLIYSGVRISELLDLKKEDVHIEEQWFKVQASKTTSGIRIVPIADNVISFWKDFMEKSESEYAVCTVDGKKLSYDNFKKRYWQPIMEQLNMKHTIHETRHTCISQLTMKNVNPTIIKKIVGHKSIMSLTERVYTHIEIQELVNAVNTMD